MELAALKGGKEKQEPRKHCDGKMFQHNDSRDMEKSGKIRVTVSSHTDSNHYLIKRTHGIKEISNFCQEYI